MKVGGLQFTSDIFVGHYLTHILYYRALDKAAELAFPD